MMGGFGADLPWGHKGELSASGDAVGSWGRRRGTAGTKAGFFSRRWGGDTVKRWRSAGSRGARAEMASFGKHEHAGARWVHFRRRLIREVLARDLSI